MCVAINEKHYSQKLAFAQGEHLQGLAVLDGKRQLDLVMGNQQKRVARRALYTNHLASFARQDLCVDRELPGLF